MGIRLHEAVDAMFVRALAGGDGIPQHGRQDRLEGGNVALDAVADHVIQGGHEPGVNQRTCDLPVGCVPANEQNFPCEYLRQTNSSGLPEKAGEAKLRKGHLFKYIVTAEQCHRVATQPTHSRPQQACQEMDDQGSRLSVQPEGWPSPFPGCPPEWACERWVRKRRQ